MLDLVKLKTFQVVAAMGSVTRAAAKLGYSQSNVTTQIKALELELGRSLFERSRFGVALTDSGRRALAYAGKLLTLEAEAKVLIHEPELPSGILHISAPESLLAYYLPRLFGEYRRMFPGVHLSVLSLSDLASQVDAVLGGAADLALVIDSPFAEDRMNVEDICDAEIVAVVSPNHALLQLRSADLPSQLRTETLLCETLRSYHFANRIWSERQLKDTNVLELGSVTAAKRCAAAGLGFAVLPLFTVEEELANGQLIALDLPVTEAIIQQLLPRDRALLPAAEEFCRLAREHSFGRREFTRGS
jgi:DNA-binding transcriptional LysR family regulator